VGGRDRNRKVSPRHVFLKATSEDRRDLNRLEPRTVDLPWGRERRESGVENRGRNRGDVEAEKGIAQLLREKPRVEAKKKPRRGKTNTLS
jgi:hypothetical protein